MGGETEEGSVVVAAPAARKKKRGGRKHKKGGGAAASSQGPQEPAGATMEERKHALLAAAQAKAQGAPDAVYDPTTAAAVAAAAASDRADKDTLMSRRSSTRSHVSKGSGHQARNTARLARHLEKQGLVYSPHEALRKRVEGAEVATQLHGTMASTMYGHVVQTTATDEHYAENLVHDMFRKEPPPLNSIVAAAITEENLVQRTEQHFIRSGRCHLCDKDAHETHLSSKRHQEMVAMSAAISFVLGMPSMYRRNFMGIERVNSMPMTRVLFRSWWGAACENMQTACRRIFESPLVSGVDFRTPKTSWYMCKSLLEITELLVIPYRSGQGMYSKHAHRTIAIKWQNLAEGDHDAVDGIMDVCPQNDTSLGYWPILRWRARPTATPWEQREVNSQVFVSCIYQWIESPEEGRVTAWMLDEAELPMIPEMP